MENKFILNLRTGKLHIKDYCHISKKIKPEYTKEYYTTEEAEKEVREKYTIKFDLCGLCFEKNKK